MKKIEITKEMYEKVEEIRKKNKEKRLEKKLRVISLRYQGLKDYEIGKITGYSVSRVSHLFQEFKKYGLEEYIKSKYKGNHRSLSEEREDEILAQFEKKINEGQSIAVKDIKQAFDEEIGKDTGRGYIYMLLERKGWKKLMYKTKQAKKYNEEENGY